MASVADSWAKAKAEWGTHGPSFFMKLFADAPDTYEPFAKTLFKGKAVGTVKDTDEMKAQAQSFAGLIDDWVANINDAGKLKELCSTFSTKHKARQVKKAQVEKAFGIFAEYMAANFGADKDAWQAVAKSLLGLMTLD